jgi:hypothetical protein
MKNQEYENWRARYLRKRKMNGRKCDSNICGHVFAPEDRKQVDHIVRRTARPDLECDERNVRITCGCAGSLDFDRLGRHTNNFERFREIRRHFGSEAEKYAREKMAEAGQI